MTVELHMLPVPAGDATLIIDRSQGRPYTVLIDAGLVKDELVSYIQKIEINRLDLIILSHPDLDHLQGLLSILDNPQISLGQVWCFDLAFLKELVTTRKIPRPQKPTHTIIYEMLLRTLVGMDKVLKTLGERKVLTLQVSAGHRLTLGSLYIEVLYPWDGFYEALRSPAQIKKLLAKKWPVDWLAPELVRDIIENKRKRPVNKRPALARKISGSQEQEILKKLLKEGELQVADNDIQPLAIPEEEDDFESVNEELPENRNSLPISLVGTLYNNLSIVAKIHVLGGINPPTMLFPGDLTDWTYLIARRFADLPVDIFKYPHHGSAEAGISRRVLQQFGFPFPRCCPCGPWCYPDCCERHFKFWKKILQINDASQFFSEIVRPKHTLIYPYPSQGLPKPSVSLQGLGQINTNRQKAEVNSLADSSNLAVACILEIKNEKIKVLPVGT